MSLYTNDTDTLRQMISQAIPQGLMALFTIIVTFISMLVLSPLLTILAVAVIFIMMAVTDVYKRQDESNLHLQTEETDGYMFATVDEIKAFAAEGKFLHYDSIKKAFERR